MDSRSRVPSPLFRLLLLRLAAICCLTCMPALSHAQISVQLAWDPSPDSDVTGYKIYYGTSSGVYTNQLDAGNITTCTVSGIGNGTTYFACTAYNSSGLESAPSEEISYTPDSSNLPPTVSVSANSSTSGAATSITLQALAADPDGSVAKVEFYSGGKKLGESTSPPYSYVWTGVSAGSYSFTAVATDDSGASATSRAATAVVNGVPSQAGSFSFDAISAGQVNVAGEPGHAMAIAYSPDMKTWTSLGNVTLGPDGKGSLADYGAGTAQSRFYLVGDGQSGSAMFGFMKLKIAGRSNKQAFASTYLSLPLLNATTYAGTVFSAGLNTITDSMANWPDAQINARSGGYYVEITSGTLAGATADITSADSTAKILTLAEDLSPLLAQGNTYTIRQHRTIGDTFGPANETGLMSGTSISASDEVQLFDPSTQSYLRFYYQSADAPGGAGWRSENDSYTDASAEVLYVEQGLIVLRRDSGDRTLTLNGVVKAGPTLVPITSGANLVADVYPGGTVTLASSGLYTGNDFTGVASGTSASSADEIQIWNGKSLLRYFYKTGAGWRLSGSTVSAGNTQISAGSSFQVVRKAGHPAFNWQVRAPF